MSRVVLATRNPHKLDELRRILAPYNVELLSLDDVGVTDDVAETGMTFADNALLKARAASAASGLPAVADDSGLAVGALNGMPGVFSARWCGRHGDDAANLELLLAQIRDVPDDRRDASFVCAAALVLPDGREVVVEERLDGAVIREPRGHNGFGYDPIFVAAGEVRTNAELTAAEKDAISHRGKAFRALAPKLAELLRAAR